MLAKYLAPVLARRGIHYGWLMVAITFLTQLCTAAMGNAGVLLVPLKQEFGWDTAAVSGPLSLRLLLYGLVAPFAAAVMLRYGLRVTVFAALTLIVGGLLLATRVTEIWHLWVTWGILIGLGTGMTAMVLGATVANRWFTARRGLVLGVLAASVATGQLVFLPIAAWLAEHVGWRAAVMPAAGGALLCLVLILLLARDYPAEVGLPPFGESRVIPVPPRNAAGNAGAVEFPGARGGRGLADVLGAVRDVPGVRAFDLGAGAAALHSAVPRFRDSRGRGRRVPGDHGGVRLLRHDRLGLAVRPGR
jgi:MFS family permease